MPSLRKGLFLLILLGSISSLGAEEAIDKSKYVGAQYRGVIPGEVIMDGVVSNGGQIISGPPLSPGPVYGVSVVSKGNAKMLWLEYSVDRDAAETGRAPMWRVKDVLVLPFLEKSQQIRTSSDFCKKDGKELANLFILADDHAEKIQRAWLVNSKTEKFHEISLRGIRCQFSD